MNSSINYNNKLFSQARIFPSCVFIDLILKILIGLIVPLLEQTQEKNNSGKILFWLTVLGISAYHNREL